MSFDPDHLDGFGTPGWGRRAVALTGLCYGGGLLASIILIMMGGGMLGSHPRESLITAGLVGLLLVITLAPAALVVAVWASTSQVQQLVRRLDELQIALRLMSEQSTLSDQARRVLNRAAERDKMAAFVRNLSGGEA